jgi:hypothetical protein
MKQIRNGVWETNSSSTHSVSISIKDSKNGLYDTIIPDDKGVITLKRSDFDGGREVWLDPIDKANYCVSVIFKRFYDENITDDALTEDDRKMVNMLKSVIKSHTGAKKVVIDFNHEGYLPGEYVQKDMLESKEKLKAFIFSRWSYIMCAPDEN